ncbi:MAG: hypothetical protein RMJ56_15930 [Gemmataceae bacterium]|nr:hypothetical protein [Gemmata sp.]MDW8199085.1 hypothetical protein [Gemmataceae bacterium]
MSTEQKPTLPSPAHHDPTEARPEPTALARWLSTAWDRFKSGQLLSYPVMALLLILIAGTAFGIWLYYERKGAASAKWAEWDALSSLSELNEYAENNSDTLQGRLARLEIARRQLGEDGIALLSSPDPATRQSAIANIEKAREAFSKLVDEFSDNSIAKVECLMACAKAEAILIGMPKEGQLEQFRGDPAKAIEWLDKLAQAAPDTPWGQDAQKLSETLKNQNTRQQVITLQASVYVMPSLPSLDNPSPRP